MKRNAINKRTIFCFTLVIGIGLLFFGMRLPDLSNLVSNGGKPKPRPRAIVQNQIKTCKQVIAEPVPVSFVAVVVEPDMPLPAQEHETTFSTFDLKPETSHGHTDHPTRAPPA